MGWREDWLSRSNLRTTDCNVRLSTLYYPVFRNTCSDSGALGFFLALSSNFASPCVYRYGEILVSTNRIAVLYDVKVVNPLQFPISIIFYLYTRVTPFFGHSVSLECGLPFPHFVAQSGLSRERFHLQHVR